jgi:cob(I)alamin adenosyltransferase
MMYAIFAYDILKILKIYTKTGDKGDTGLFAGPRVPKNDPQIAAYGTVDELNAVLGVIRSDAISDGLKAMLARIQNELFDVGADLATPTNKDKNRISPELSSKLEDEIDDAEEKLAPLTQFILPGGTRAAALLHFARTVCRRAEREIVSTQQKSGCNPNVLIYVNRLSDWLFVMARLENHLHGVADVPWKKM